MAIRGSSGPVGGFGGLAGRPEHLVGQKWALVGN